MTCSVLSASRIGFMCPQLEMGLAELARQGHDPRRLRRHAPGGRADPGAAHPQAAQERCTGPGHSGGCGTRHQSPARWHLQPGGAVHHGRWPHGPVHLDGGLLIQPHIGRAVGWLAGWGLLVAGVIVYSTSASPAAASTAANSTLLGQPAREQFSGHILACAVRPRHACLGPG